MNIDQLREFCTVVRFRSITKAAEFLYISQPSLSRHISELEQSLGAELIIRGNSRVFALTTAGEMLFQEGEELLRKIGETESHIKHLGDGSIGNLRVCSKPLCLDKWVQLLVSFNRRHPNIELCYFDSDDGGLTIRDLLSGYADAVLTYDYEICQHLDELNVLHLAPDSMVALVSNCSPLAEFSSVTVERLQRERMLIVRTPQTGFLDKGPLDDVLRLFLHNSIPTKTFTSMILQTQIDQGFSVFPRAVAQMYVPACRILEIEGLAPSINIVLAWKKDCQNPALRSFVDYVKAELDRR